MTVVTDQENICVLKLPFCAQALQPIHHRSAYTSACFSFHHILNGEEE